MRKVWEKYKDHIVNFSLLAGLLCWLIFCWPVSPSPICEFDTYQEFVGGLTGWRQGYLIPPEEDLQIPGCGIYYQTYIHTKRASYRPKEYICTVYDTDAGYTDHIVCRGIKEGPLPETAPPLKTVYQGTDIFYDVAETGSAARFCYDGVCYDIQTTSRAPVNALGIARDMLDGGYPTGPSLDGRKMLFAMAVVGMVAGLGVLTSPYLVSGKEKEKPEQEPRKDGPF